MGLCVLFSWFAVVKTKCYFVTCSSGGCNDTKGHYSSGAYYYYGLCSEPSCSLMPVTHSQEFCTRNLTVLYRDTPPCQIQSQSVSPLQGYSDFFDFLRWQPSAILDLLGHIWTTHNEYLAVFITVQNLVAIDPVMGRISKIQYGDDRHLEKSKNCNISATD